MRNLVNMTGMMILAGVFFSLMFACKPQSHSHYKASRDKSTYCSKMPKDGSRPSDDGEGVPGYARYVAALPNLGQV